MLNSNRQYFESCVQIAEKLFQEGLYEECINYIEKTVFFAWFNFSGYYKSEHLEILLSKIQEKILPDFSFKEQIKSNQILHICSELYTFGGHTKLLYSWIKNDSSKKHTILATRQSKEELEEKSLTYIPNVQELNHISLKASSKIESANLLHEHLQQNSYDLILLHIHPDEVIPNIVLSQKSLKTPVCFINHADHVFWLGTAIADIILQIRESSILYDVERRGIPLERQFFLPIPVDNASEIKKDKKDPDAIHLLSTGKDYKFNPNENYNFLREAYRIVEENRNVIFNIVGIDPDSAYGKEYKHDRIILHGIIPASALENIEKSIDIYVEGFPMVSFTALLQASLQKIPFALHYNPLPLFKLFEDNNNGAIAYPQNLEEWHENLKKLITDKNFRAEIREEQYQYVLKNFSAEFWKSRVKELYNITENITHTFHKPTSDVYYSGENEKLLVTIDKREISHFSFTRKLSLRNKYFVYQSSKQKNANVTYLKFKKLIKYFLKKK